MKKDFAREGSLLWYIGMLVAAIGFALMFNKAELKSFEDMFERYLAGNEA